MNRKQAVIIVTLLVLIICAGALATKVRSPLYVNDTDFTNDNKSAISMNDSSSTNKDVSKSDYFVETRLTRDQTDSKLLQELKAIIDDQNTSKEQKDNATKKSIETSTAMAQAAKVENQLKAKGFLDAICFVESSSVKVVVKTDNGKLTEQQQREIKEVVLGITQNKNIQVSVKS
ncbi:MAG: SpoIIIAH-like family protein [Bacillota bacterium]|nr:SpoIIIAH-like family protein [Bacillota bacterium]